MARKDLLSFNVDNKQPAASGGEPQALDASEVEHAEVLAELNQQQTRKKGWGAAMVILLVSMVLFVAAGATQWSLGFVALLIPILLFHELGHYVAMRIFKYRNVRMFFIPFFGAAVMGQHHSVAGWKKVIVSMMGPLPGIVVGIGLGVAGMLMHKPALIHVAVATLILNGFNLLPVLPLDGGWVMHALFFSRHYMLDFAFRCVAAAALIFGSFALNQWILLFVGIPLTITLPIAYKMARIANELRARRLPPALPNDSQMPVQTAQAIIGEVKKAFPKGLNNKAIAQYTAQIFETLNSRPPGVLATIGLLLVYGGSVALATVFSFLFVVAEHGDVGDFLNAAAAQPKYDVACADVETWRAAGFQIKPGEPRVTVIATYPPKADVKKLFQSRASELTHGGSITRFGSSLFVSFPAADHSARQRWETQLRRESRDMFLVGSNRSVIATITCIAPTPEAASAIEDEVNEFLRVPGSLYLVPPWAGDDTRSDAERQQHRSARKAFLAEQAADTNYQALTASSPLGKDMGQLPIEGDKPAPGTDRYSPHYGLVSRNGWLVSFHSISFVNVVEGAPALVKWLCSRGCSNIKYQFFADHLAEIE